MSDDSALSTELEDPQPAQVEEDTPELVADDEVAADLQTAQELTDDDSIAAEGSVELTLSFSGDCWTEVTDATGRRLYFDLGTDGRSVTLSGVEPLGVLLGNSLNVSIQVNGFDYSIPAANRRGNTARLTIYGQ